MATRGKEIVEDGATREEDIFGKRVRSSDDGDLTEDIKKRGRIGLENFVLGVEDMVIDEYFPPTCSSSNDLSETDITYTSWEMVEQKINVKILETEIMWRCLKFCLLFPKDYEIDREEIIQLWIAAGFFEIPPTREILENNVGRYFEEFERCHIFQASSFQYSSQRLRYRLNSSIVDLSRELLDCDYFRIHDFESHISERTLHSSFFDSRIDPFILKKLYQAKNLHTLLILHEPGSLLDQVPRELFLKLPFLRVLDLSHMNISELPSSIGKLKYLRYLNLSNTPLTALPNSVCGLYQMQTLKLRGCSKLVGLPKGFRKLINLQHLDLDIACLLVSMPPGIGDLRQLHSLSAFVVGKHDGCHITELKHMVNLGGTLRILRLENVCSTEEAKEAALDHKKYLNKLELEWSKLDDGLQLLENLQPHATIEELQIVGYGGVKFPSWIGDPVFSKLVTISIHNCRICKVLPPLGSLPLLFDLCVSEMYEVTVIDHQFCGRKTDIGSLELGRLELQPIYVNSSNAVNFNAFPRLGKLTLNGMPKLEKWSGVEEGDFPNLQKLSISGCSRLTTISKLSNFKSLLQLEISHCPSFIFLPKEELPENLGNLAIIDCLLLKELCHKEVEYDCGILKHIPDVWIDYKQISGTHLSPRTGSLHGNVPVHLTSAVGVGMGVGKYSSDAGISAKDQVSEEGKNDLVMSVPPTRRRRKGESKKVVCVPVPAAANSSSPSREFVHSDLWGWRKYGQKPIKGSPYPRGYYRCSTSKGCSARKQVERSLTDPNMLVITYTSEHNHPLPTQRNAIAGPTRSQSPKSSDAGAENYSSLPTDLESILQPDELRILQPDDIFTGFTDLELNLPADLNELVTSDQGKEH